MKEMEVLSGIKLETTYSLKILANMSKDHGGFCSFLWPEPHLFEEEKGLFQSEPGVMNTK